MKSLKWPTYTVKDFIDSGEAKLQTGPFGTQLHSSDYVDSGIPLINPRNIGFGQLKQDKLEYISNETANRLIAHHLQKGDIVFGRKGTVDRHILIKEVQEGWFQGSDCLRIRFKSSMVNNQFVSYLLLTEYHKEWIIGQSSHGATMTSLNQGIVGRIPLKLPKIQIQNKIASILSSYDDLIENNTSRIKILEEMAQAIYREWFVHFRFPRHEGVRMVESELGLIPEGWELTNLGSVTENFDRKRKPLSSLQREKRKGEYPYYGAAKIFDYIDDYLFDGYYLLIAEDGSVITTDNRPVLQLVNGKFWANNHTHIIQGKSPFSIEYLYLRLKDLDVSGYITGAAQPKINQENLNRIPMLSPQNEVLLLFNSYIEEYFKQIFLLEKKNAKLRRTRDLLLPKLISGEIDVSEKDIKIPEAEA